jgi:hypothetical protein
MMTAGDMRESGESQRPRSEWIHAAAWLAALFVPLAIMRFSARAGDGPFGVDASFYYQLARHVMRGEGLVSYLSLYHAGFHLPAPSWMYPAWPLLLGYTGRVIGLTQAANDLPRVLYLADLLLLYALTRVIALRLGGLRFVPRWYVPDSAHLLTVAFAMNVSFFGTTTHPYREPLAFAATFAALLCLERYASRRSLFAIALSASFAAIAYLTRVQMATVPFATALVLALDARRDPRSRRALALYLGVAALVVLPWFLHLGFIPGASRFTWRATERETLPLLQDAPRSGITTERVLDWIQGAFVEFQIGNQYSYVATFGVAALLVPIAAVVWLLSRGQSRASTRVDPTKLAVYATVISGVLLFVALLWYRSDYLPFLFGWRHGLTLIVLLAVAVPYLMSDSRPAVRILTATLLVISIGTGFFNVLQFIAAPPLSYSAEERALIAWLPASMPRRPTILTTNAQALSVGSDVYMHNTFCDSTPETTRAFLRLFPIDYLIVYEQQAGCRYLGGLDRELAVRQVFGAPGRRIFVLAPVTRRTAG